MDSQDARRTFKTGDVVMRQGEKGACAYIIEDGLVEILVEKPGGRVQPVGTRGPGTIIGEMAIVDDAPRTATIKALKDCRMLEITRDDFSQRLKASDPVMQTITQVILTRYRDMLTRADILGATESYPPPEMLERNFTEQADVVESIKIANEFRVALDKKQLSLHYQPIVDLADGSVVGFEALMRWVHPTQGFISPGLFIPIAEKSGLIVEASRWALKEACEALLRIENKIRPNRRFYVSVNFSSHDFAEKDFVDNVVSTIRGAGTDPRQIKLEITERLLIQRPDEARAALQACRDAGIGIAIDDFGTGYSSLSYLYYFPIETLKIDQSFVRAMGKEERSLEIVKSIAGLGRNMGLTVIAEGVEDMQEARTLRGMGCEFAQGYHFARPMAEDKVIETLLAWQPLKIPA